MPEAVKLLVCNACGKTFEERKEFPGLKICDLCDALGRGGVRLRGNVEVFTVVV
jgi:hypothetical protein